jgi:uncharacterized protein
MRAVFDTNVLMAAFLTDGLCAKLLMRARRREFYLISCPFIVEEFQRFLQKKIKANTRETQIAIKLLEEAVNDIFTPSIKITPVCRDAEDDNVLACVLEAKADYLVTGDEDLLILSKYKTTKIISPRNFESLFIDD